MKKHLNTMEDNYFDSSNLYVFLYKYKFHLGVLFVLSTLVSSLVSLNIQEKYKSIAVVYPSNTSSVAKALISSRFGGKTDIMEFGEEEKSEQLLEVLNSDKVRSKLVDQYDLMAHYDIKLDETSTPNFDLHEIFSENIWRLFLTIFFDLKKGPKKENKREKIFLLILIPKIRPTRKNK